MRATTYHTKIKNAERLTNKTNRWKILLNKYSYDARFELSNIYTTLTNTSPSDDSYMVTNGHFSFRDTSTVYIYELSNTIYYGPLAESYPMDDESLWPWTVNKWCMPQLSVDIWASIAKFMCVRQILTLGMVNVYLNKISKNNKIGKKHCKIKRFDYFN